jgi:hypothetical protein
MKVRLLSAAALAACLAAAGVSAQWWDEARGGGRMIFPGQYTRPDIDRARLAIQRAMHAGDFEKLERMHDEFLKLQLAAGPGRFMLSSFRDMFSAAGSDRPRLAAMFERWKRERPKSPLRAVLESAAWVDSAWSHRGTGYASSVSPEAMRLFKADIERAAKVLQEVSPGERSTPIWYSQAVAIAALGGRPPEVLDALFEEGVAKFPIDWALHEYRLNFLLPQWGGSYPQMERFIRATVLRTQASEGTSMYARLWLNQVGLIPEQKDFFGTTGADWRVMRHAFEDAITLEDSLTFRNGYAGFACMAGDRETLRRVLAGLGERADLGGMGRFVSPDACIEMARGER